MTAAPLDQAGHPAAWLEWWDAYRWLTVDHVRAGSRQLTKRQLPGPWRKDPRMRSARVLLATAAASAVLAVTAPGAHASAGDWDHDDSSYSKEHHKGGGHDAPRGGMHTGGGALAAMKADDPGTARDPKHDPETYKDSEPGRDSSWTKDSEDSWSGGREKPSGGMHTGGGALAAPGLTAGGLAVLAVAGTGLYAVRRKKSHGLA
jgi:hypothetical protein